MDKREPHQQHEELDGKGAAFLYFIQVHWTGILSTATILVIFCLCMWLWFRYVKTRKVERVQQRVYKRIFGSMNAEEAGLKFFSFEEIRHATKGFDTRNLLGEGAQGAVFKGKLYDGTEVAVKRSLKMTGRAITQFRGETSLVARLSHKNVVILLGCCVEGRTETPLLVYDYHSGGNLLQLLYRQRHQLNPKKEDIASPWSLRHKIATNIAEGLVYLHTKDIWHRDIKLENILLDDTLQPKIADFGVAKRFSQEDEALRKISLGKGTCGYMCPQYCSDGIYANSCDTYSFAVLLAELITGLRALFTNKEGRVVNLATHFVKESKRNLNGILADQVASSDEKTKGIIQEVASLVRRCVIPRRDDRPTMESVLNDLQKLQQQLPDDTTTASSSMASTSQCG